MIKYGDSVEVIRGLYQGKIGLVDDVTEDFAIVYIVSVGTRVVLLGDLKLRPDLQD